MVVVEADLSRPVADLTLSRRDVSLGVLLSAWGVVELVGLVGVYASPLEGFGSVEGGKLRPAQPK